MEEWEGLRISVINDKYGCLQRAEGDTSIGQVDFSFYITDLSLSKQVQLSGNWNPNVYFIKCYLQVSLLLRWKGWGAWNKNTASPNSDTVKLLCMEDSKH